MRWSSFVVCAGLAGFATADPVPRAAQAADPPLPAGKVRPAPAWTLVIAPSHGPALVAEFHEDADGGLTVTHNPVAAAPLATIPPGGPDLPAIQPGPEVLAPPALAAVPPAPPAEAAAPAPSAVPADGHPPLDAGVPHIWGHRPSYAEIYYSIPFIRPEYDANPSYRHETTMELLFGQLRPMVINKNVPTPITHTSNYEYYTPHRIWNGSGYVNYHIFYPRPGGYRY